ncbi:MAG: GNAT family N-acetyltransferase [Alistipes sp.]|nr:GNAT family N-acetyltransferase [Alistipes sp.]
MSSPIEIRRAGIGDIEAIRAVADKAFRATYAEILSPRQTDYMMEMMYSAESLHRQIEIERQAFYLAEDNGRTIGYVSIERQDERLFHLQKIYILPECQNRRIGRQLFECACRHVKTLCPEPCTMELNVNRHNRALGFYQRMGMRKVREGDFDIGNGYFMNDYIMAIEL